MKIQPTADYIFLSIEEKKENKGGIILSDISQDKYPIGLVEAVGLEVKHIKAGDQIIFNAFIAKEIEFENKKFFLIKAKDVFAICPKK